MLNIDARNKNGISMTNPYKWAEVDHCDWFDGCKCKVTHVVFANVPMRSGWPYAVGACNKHKGDGEYPYVTLTKFNKVVGSLRKSHKLKDAEDLAFAVMDELDPTL